MELFQPFLERFLPLFQVSAAAKILFFSETSLLKQEYFLKISPIKTIFPLWGELLLMCIKLFIHPHLESFTAQCLQVGGGILGEISAQVVHHIIETFFATLYTSPNSILEILAATRRRWAILSLPHSSYYGSIRAKSCHAKISRILFGEVYSVAKKVSIM